MPLAGIEPEISSGERPQTYALDRAAILTYYLRVVLLRIPGSHILPLR